MTSAVPSDPVLTRAAEVSTSGGAQPRNLTANYDYDVMGGVGGDQAPPRASRGPGPSWSVDGKSVVDVTAEEGKANLKRIDVASGRVQPWTSGNQAVLNFATVRGKTVALVSTPTMMGDLFLVGENGTMTRLPVRTR